MWWWCWWWRCKEVKVSIELRSVTRRIICLRLTPAIAAQPYCCRVKKSFQHSTSNLEQRWTKFGKIWPIWEPALKPPPPPPVSPAGHYDKAILQTRHNEIWCRYLVTQKSPNYIKMWQNFEKRRKNCSNFMRWLEDGVCEITGVQI